MIPRNVIDNLKCSLCKNSLSIFPIHSFGSKDIVSCGRCPLKEDFLPQREHLYEELAQHIEFACRYESNGCIEKLKPDELQYHENHCPHKPCFCPILPLGSCKWVGEPSDLFKHYEDVHPNLAYRDFIVEIHTLDSYEENYVFSQADETFVAQLKFFANDGNFYCNVRYCGLTSAARKFAYRACFVSKKKKYGCEVRPVQAGEFGPICTESVTVVNIANIIANLNNAARVAFKVDVFIKKTPAQKREETIVAPIEENDVLKMLECPVCLDYMMPPIRQCNAGHSLCQSCRDKLTICPTCKCPISDIRNYALEQITSVLQYPCKYNKYGCTFVANVQNVRDHETNCENRPYKCVIDNCPWKNEFSNLKKHLNEVHKNNILETNTLTYLIDYSENYETYQYIIIQDDKIFNVEFIRDNEDFLWHLNIASKTEENCDQYTLILDFGSQTDDDRLYIQKKTNMVEFQLQQLENFINDGVLMYKMRVIQPCDI